MEIIGWIGTVLVVVAYLPQIRHLYVERCAWGISISTWVIWLIASAFLLAYAIVTRGSTFIAVQAINLIAIVLTINWQCEATGSVRIIPTTREKSRPPVNRMLYLKQMAEQTERTAVDPKLRRKMLERWENEGGKVGEIDSNLTSPNNPNVKTSRKRQTKTRSVKGKE
jgi:uncharacterized protein with PQ loop repeat